MIGLQIVVCVFPVETWWLACECVSGTQNLSGSPCERTFTWDYVGVRLLRIMLCPNKGNNLMQQAQPHECRNGLASTSPGRTAVRTGSGRTTNGRLSAANTVRLWSQVRLRSGAKRHLWRNN